MIHTAQFENFKGLRNVSVTFDTPFTVLVGPNGSGKTSILQGIELVVESWFRGRRDMLSHLALGADRTTTLLIVDEIRRGWGITNRPQGKPDLSDRISFILNKDGQNVVIPHPEKNEHLGSVLRPHYRSSQIATPSITQNTPPPVQIDGTGLPSLLGYLKLRDDELFDRIEEHFCRVIPNIKKIRVDRGQVHGGVAGEVILFDTTLANKISAEHMSDGTLYVLALIVAILGPHRPKTLLIDDLDLRLHPKAQYEFVTLLKGFLQEFPDLQIIATSHSPYILDKLDANEVRVTGLGTDGSVIVAKIDEHPSYEQWKTAMSPGEFWSHTGEEWLKNLKREVSRS